MKQQTAKKAISIVFICVFLVMLAFNFLTPMISDDFAHYYSYNGNHPSSIAELFKALPLISTNSRWIPHFFVFTFLSLPRAVFAIINAAVSTVILFLVFRFYRSEDYSHNLILLILSIFMAWYFTPGFGQIFLWLTGACNYSWGLALYLILSYPFFCKCIGKNCKVLDRNNLFIRILYFLLAFVVGAYSENGGASTICLLTLLAIIIWYRDKKFPLFFFIVIVFTFAGFAALMLAPNTSGNSAGISIFDNAKNCILLLKKFSMVLFIIFAATLSLSIFCKVDKYRILVAFAFVIAGLSSVLVFIFAKYLPARSFMILTFYLIVAILVLSGELLKCGHNVPIYLFGSIMLVVFLFSFILGAGDILSLYLQSVERERIITNAVASGETDIELKPYAASGIYPAAYDEELSVDASFWYNEFIAEYYGLDSVMAEVQGQ